MAEKMNPATTGGRAGLGNVVAGEQTTSRETSATCQVSQASGWIPLGNAVLLVALGERFRTARRGGRS